MANSGRRANESLKERPATAEAYCLVGTDRSSAFREDTIVVEAPHLRIVDEETFLKVLALRPKACGKPPSSEAMRNVKHPLVRKLRCPRCNDGIFLINSYSGWMRCSNAKKGDCDCPSIAFAETERLMYEALAMLTDGREDGFARRARSHYEDILQTGLAERKQLQERIDILKGRIRDLVRNSTENPYVRANLDELAEEYTIELDEKIAQLHDMPSIPTEPDPDKSLLVFRNLIARLQEDAPNSFGSSEEALRLRNSLGAAVHEVQLVERGDHRYDVIFSFNIGPVLGSTRFGVERVRLSNRCLGVEQFKAQRRNEQLGRVWRDGIFHLTDEEWSKVPRLPVAEHKFGRHLRWALDVFIMMAETKLGCRMATRIGGQRVKEHLVLDYRGSEELEVFRTWISKVRPRNDDWDGLRPTNNLVEGLRTRLEAVQHPLLRLDRCKPDYPDVPMTDEEWEGLAPLLPTSWMGRRVMRQNIDWLFQIIRKNQYFIRSGRPNTRDWFKRAHGNGKILAIVNYFLDLEGKPTCDRLPDLFYSNWKRRRKRS